MPRKYKNEFTLDGRVRPGVGVTKKKVSALTHLIDEAFMGDRTAKGQLEEAISTSDAMFNYTHLVGLNFVPQFDEAPRLWTKIASVRQVSDFREVIDYELDPQWDSNTLGDGDPVFTAPRVPEGTPYPEAYFSGQAVSGAKLAKYGFGTGFTFEAFLNDSLGVISQMPDKMRTVALDTEEAFVFNALKSEATAAQALAAGTNPDGGAVVANAPFTRDAAIQAMIQVKQRKHNGRYIQFNGGFILVVAPGMKINADWQLYGQSLLRVEQTGGRVYSAADQQLVSGITEIIESPFVEGNAWYLVPTPGAIRGHNGLQILRLIGREAPELRIENVTGQYVGGGAVSPFEGSFDTDTARFRIRMFGKGHNFFPDGVIWSDGTGS